MGRNRTHDTTTRTETGTAPMAIDPRIVTISNTHMSHPLGMPTCPTSSGHCAATALTLSLMASIGVGLLSP